MNVLKFFNEWFLIIVFIFLVMGTVGATDVSNSTVLDSIDDFDSEDINDYSVNYKNSGLNDSLLVARDSSDVLAADDVGSFRDLDTLVKGTDAGATLVLDKDYIYNAGSDSAYKEGIGISRSITIDGQGHIISGGNQSRIFEITGDNVILKNITFKDACANLYAGAMIWSGDDGLINHCTFDHSQLKDTSNVADALAAAVLVRGANVVINNTVFKNGNNPYIGDSDGCAGVVVYGVNDVVENCIFINNSGYISALDFGTAANNCRVNNCSVINSTSQHALVFSRRSQIPFTNCQFINNEITAGAKDDAAIWVRGATVVSGCYFENNRLRTPLLHAGTDIINCTFNNNIMLNDCPMIILDTSASRIEGCKFYNHKYTKNSAMIRASTGLSIKDCEFENNSLNYYIAIGNVDLVSLLNCTFKNNKLTRNNYYMIAVGGTANRTTITDCKFINNTGNMFSPIQEILMHQ